MCLLDVGRRVRTRVKKPGPLLRPPLSFRGGASASEEADALIV